ncbi:MAG: oxidoreductase [Eggerthellaceae bacterium]|nr:oxidoreductase [Eggerthellaceae bacterium]
MESKKGLLIDVTWCTGCYSCQVACQMEHQMPVGQYGIKVFEVGPWEYGDGNWQLAYIPTTTDQCDLCEERVSLGKVPTCVQHCQAQCLEFGPLEELAAKLADHPKQVLIAL